MQSTQENNILFGKKLIEDKPEDFQREAIVRFTEFDRLMALTNPDGNYHTIGYPTIVANLVGEYAHRQSEQDRKADEAKAMMSQLGGLMGGM